MNEFVETLKQEGIAEVHYIGNLEKQDFIPNYVTAPWMLPVCFIILNVKMLRS